ncbi:hypothetical protein BV25DRAFT_1453335 [Artomyces pyxidatus]|uniref:Uncharacterized protein n=1 Tax=Artomyces pyxidatus TaxID=48021 RepID=A0ACB8SMJ2_9AGAM|nr:hypothetical protein BV25DRAFT_1453335 [Artomyces pyxidatus]
MHCLSCFRSHIRRVIGSKVNQSHTPLGVPPHDLRPFTPPRLSRSLNSVPTCLIAATIPHTPSIAPLVSSMPAIEGSVSSDFPTPNPFSGGFLFFFFAMLLYMTYAMLVFVVTFAIILLGYYTGLVLYYVFLEDLVLKYGPSVRDWWAGGPSRLCDSVCGSPARIAGYFARCFVQVRDRFAVLLDEIRKWTGRTDSREAVYVRLDSEELLAMLGSDEVKEIE